MKECTLLPDALALAPEVMTQWSRAHAFTRALPPKVAKSRRKAGGRAR